MNIFIQQSGPSFTNLGDLAMLRVAVRRFRESFPDCSITVLSDPGLVASEYVDNVFTMDWFTVSQVFGPGCLFGRFTRVLGISDSAIVTRYPFFMHGVSWRHRVKGGSADSIAKFIRAFSAADIVAGTGGGYLTDEFPYMVERTAWLLLAAQRLGKRTALFGQGVGPLQTRELRLLLAEAVRDVEVIGLREGVFSPTLLNELGLDGRKCIVTGDDALELPYAAARAGMGTKLGVNLRRAYYSGISSQVEGRVSRMLSQLLAELRTVPVVIPIAKIENDAEVGAELLGHSSFDRQTLEVSDAIRIAGECRVVITGSYHAAVFALGQGIPVVCLVGSDYYRNKFHGLAGQFSSGCLVVETDGEDFEKIAADNVISLWQTAEALRPRLLEAAKEQVERSRSLYREFADNHVSSGGWTTGKSK